MSAIGNTMLVLACIFIGQYPTIGITKSINLTLVMWSLFECGNGIILISSIDRVYRQVVRKGRSDNMETYLMVSGKREYKYSGY